MSPPPPLSPAERRQRLLARSAALRVQLAQDAQGLAGPLAVADAVGGAARWLWRHPEWPLGALVVLVVLRPRRAWRWASRAWWAWGLWQRAERLLGTPRR